MGWIKRLLGKLAEGIGTALGTVCGCIMVRLGPKLDLQGLVDKTDGAVDGDADVAPSDAVRPIHAFLAWLNDRDLLTAQGKTCLEAIQLENEDDVALTDTLVEPGARQFVANVYETWYETHGVNYAIDPSLPFDGAELDRLWENFHAKT